MVNYILPTSFSTQPSPPTIDINALDPEKTHKINPHRVLVHKPVAIYPYDLRPSQMANRAPYEVSLKPLYLELFGPPGQDNKNINQLYDEKI